MVAAIIADDLTGACDAAIHFRAVGFDTEVSLTGAVPVSEIAAFTTDSRDLPEHDIRRRIRDIATSVAPGIVFKKIDSVLRGRPGLEIAIALEAFKCDLAVIAPAYPDLGRVVRNGSLDLPQPVDIAERLQSDGFVLSRGVILDAATNDELDAIANRHFEQRVLWCGSGGLALALAKKCGRGALGLPRPPVGPVTFCIGSTHPVTLEQVSQSPGSRIVHIDRNATTADAIRALLAGPKPAALFACGGDTATMILTALGARSISLAGEVVRGVPWGTLRGGIMDGVAVVTKSGGFGAPDTLVRVAAFFNQSA